MESDDFGQCAIRAVLAAKTLSDIVFPITVHYGLFTPSTPCSSWDVRWRASCNGDGASFVHFWVRAGIIIYDCSVKQFGYVERILTSVLDARYVEFGQMDIETLHKTDNGRGIIDWNFIDSDGTPRARISY
jgi:hypothetical protein